jgi:mono/diheme cytochrome c family protein
MNRLSIVSSALGLTLAALAVAGVASGQTATRTIWDGVYTDAQALRGQQVYKQACGYCHRDDLSGGGSEDGAPALTGSSFTARWRGVSLGELVATVQETMPSKTPGTLTRQSYIDIVSFVLKQNGAPAGAAELEFDLPKLDGVLFTDDPAPQ